MKRPDPIDRGGSMKRPDPIDRALSRASWAAFAIALGVALAMVLQTLVGQS